MEPLIDRESARTTIQARLRQFPIVAILGARQVGKTTLARQVAAESATWFDLENPRDLARIADPLLALEDLSGLIVLDEVQRVPELFPLLRVLADRPDLPARFLILGSASPALLRQSSESLAGRIAYTHLAGFGLHELGSDAVDDLWVRGGFPRSFLADSSSASAEWRHQFIATYLERDLSELGFNLPSETMRRFWTMLAHGQGARWNASAMGRSFGVADTTVGRYLDTLVDTFTVRRIQPYLANISKRQVKAPRVYLRDSGLLHTLLGLDSREAIESHPVLGASWEGFAIEQAIVTNQLRADQVFHWRTSGGAELDLVVQASGQRWGFEMKRTSTPRTTRSMHTAITDLDLQHLFVVHPGTERFRLAPKITAVPIGEVSGVLTEEG